MKGQWVPNDHMGPMANIAGRRWRIVGEGREGVYVNGHRPTSCHLEWFFPYEQEAPPLSPDAKEGKARLVEFLSLGGMVAMGFAAGAVTCHLWHQLP